MSNNEQVINNIFVVSADKSIAESCRTLLANLDVNVVCITDTSESPLTENAIAPHGFIVMDNAKQKKKTEGLLTPGAHLLIGGDGKSNFLNVETPELLPTVLPALISVWVDAQKLSRELDTALALTSSLQSQAMVMTNRMKFFENKAEFVEKQRASLSAVVEKMHIVTVISQQIMSCLDLDEIAGLVIERVPLVVSARWASFFMYNYENQQLTLQKHNHPRKISEIIELSDNPDSPMAMALREKRIMVIRSIEEFEKAQNIKLVRAHSAEYASKSCIIVPLTVGNRIIGILNLADKTTGGFFDEVNDLPPLEQLATTISSAVRNYQLYSEVVKRSRTDSMTGFLNHKTFYDELRREINMAQRFNSPLSLVMFDIDKFKTVNDVYGHQLGDQIIRMIADVIKANIRNVDMPARYGGDEFCVILSRTDLEHAEHVANRILEKVRASEIRYGDTSVRVTLSLGVGEYRPNATTEEYVRIVDNCLYRAKEQGRNCVVLAEWPAKEE